MQLVYEYPPLLRESTCAPFIENISRILPLLFTSLIVKYYNSKCVFQLGKAVKIRVAWTHVPVYVKA